MPPVSVTPPSKKFLAAFNLVELLAVLATLVILFSVVLPVMAKARVKNTQATCFNNLRQLMIGWTMYRDNNSDTMLPNTPGGTSNQIWYGGATEAWTNAVGNTNRVTYANSLIAPYISGRIELLRCPGDFIPSTNGVRIRSYSMNGQMGAAYHPPVYNNTGWRQYAKAGDLICPTPASAFILAEENASSISDGYLQLSLNTPLYPRCPGYYHEGSGGSFSFADGHVELHRWLFNSGSLGILSAPYAFGANTLSWPSSGSDVDWLWLTNHSSCSLF